MPQLGRFSQERSQKHWNWKYMEVEMPALSACVWNPALTVLQPSTSSEFVISLSYRHVGLFLFLFFLICTCLQYFNQCTWFCCVIYEHSVTLTRHLLRMNKCLFHRLPSCMRRKVETTTFLSFVGHCAAHLQILLCKLSKIFHENNKKKNKRTFHF